MARGSAVSKPVRVRLSRRRGWRRSHYNASKAGMEGMTRGCAARLVRDGITVNAIAPSLIETDMARKGLASAASRTSLSRVGKPEEVMSLKRLGNCGQAALVPLAGQSSTRIVNDRLQKLP
jgi:NAD(P)-dependent dehydrogenase (short-subunit alcohol dehydrogenase family)